MSYPRNNASPERIAVGAVVQISDGAVQSSGVSISVRGQGGASGAGAGTTAYDNGIVQYTPTQGETDFTSFVVVAYKTGCIPASVTVVTSANGTPGVVVVPSTQKVDVDTIKTQSVTCAAGVTVSPYVGSTGAAINGTNANTLSGHDPGATLGTSTLTQSQVTGGAYAMNSASFAFNAALDLTTTQKTSATAAVWDVALASHITLGTTGYYLSETHATGDLSYLIVSDGTNGNAAIKTYLTTNVGLLGVNLTAADDAVISAIGALNNLSQANVRTAVGLGAANLDTQLADLPTVAEFEARTLLAAAYGTAANQSTIIGYIDTEVAAIKAKTDQLTFTVANQVDSNALSGGGSGLDAAGVRAAIGLATANLDTQLADIPTVAEFNARTLLAAAYFDPAVDIVTTTDTTNITAILADTNELQSDWVNGGRLDLILDAIASNVAAILLDTGTDGVALSAALCNKIADHVRRRTQANVEASSDGDTLSLFSLYGFIQIAQESNTTDTPGTLTVKKTDGTTTLGTRTLSSDAAADPVTGVS